MEWIGQKIFHNECGGRRECLLHWNASEAFPSLGIGHFIWYPDGVDAPFVESFPLLLEFLSARNVALPFWLDPEGPAPWLDRASFLATIEGPRHQALQVWLEETLPGQTEFLIDRLHEGLRQIDAHWEITMEPATLELHRSLIRSLMSTPGGRYALTDYVNFKGEGLSSSEQYRGAGWGLRQVLESAAGPPLCETTNPLDADLALACFRDAAIQVLTRRVENAPQQDLEAGWLPAWIRRVETYVSPSEL